MCTNRCFLANNTYINDTEYQYRDVRKKLKSCIFCVSLSITFSNCCNRKNQTITGTNLWPKMFNEIVGPINTLRIWISLENSPYQYQKIWNMGISFVWSLFKTYNISNKYVYDKKKHLKSIEMLEVYENTIICCYLKIKHFHNFSFKHQY